MELVSELPNIQLYIPAAIVVVAVTLIYVFGFKPAEQPPFDKLSSGAGDDRKTVGKKRKTKDRVGVFEYYCNKNIPVCWYNMLN